MKKIQLLVVALVATISMSAENTTTLRVWIGGEKTEYELSMVDSLTFTTTEEEPTQDPEAPLSGVFSVSADKKVMFSKGNLQYTQSTNTWAFATNQYDMIGEANVSNNELSDKIDLFGWVGSEGIVQWGVSTSESNSDYVGDFVDWGQNIGDGTTWRTLTHEEWTYLRSERANAANLMCVARIKLNIEGTEYVNGLILFPDNWISLEDVEVRSGFASQYSEQAYADYQTFTPEQWAKLEAAGAVFLPASGYRDGVSVGSVQDYGYYWSATVYYNLYVRRFDFNSIRAGWNYANRYTGKAVRLVQDL